MRQKIGCGEETFWSLISNKQKEEDWKGKDQGVAVYSFLFCGIIK